MNLNVRYANHPDDAKKYTTEENRKHYLIDDLFSDNEMNFTYSHVDRIITGGVKPVEKELVLEAGKEMGVDYFLERREMGVINIGGSGVITLDDKEFKVNNREGAYIGMGVKDVTFKSDDAKNPAKFYINSCPAHKAYPTVIIDLSKAKKVSLGSDENLNKRVIHQFVHPAVCDSCQLVMGMTILEPGSVWNTMPCHTHERRMEVYFYFDMAEDTKVFHLMGQPNETRHIVMANEQAVISPSWSIHSGVGTSNYTFIWGMCGENQTFDDMDFVEMKDLK
ncbi:5-dehydro-4-deoxy-D-glucuronate isomerase [Thiospirochaeta perfilievii]|uniref:4-deoxy-L-threo-5-hexosulose-uronate ketol-isomerase n=1 Tax=Thiospirochaeta perfilievii TaxID=252967 RepID=A0A5C1QAG3_9SPIO|nr:5-dehydro-4-deoxy-D-glucuronate isomerase [Thiospirochaeta perfilievii]QEN04328.1 5-dehydro-4-deoxy-D-glucuronate isomerase [Thiospirochaeta perfilievii]